MQKQKFELSRFLFKNNNNKLKKHLFHPAFHEVCVEFLLSERSSAMSVFYYIGSYAFPCNLSFISARRATSPEIRDSACNMTTIVETAMIDGRIFV